MTERKNKGFAAQIVQYFKDFGVLKDNPIEYWNVQIINFLHSTGYFALLTIGTVFFTANLGLSDVASGYVITAMTVGTTLCLLVIGSVTDSLGIKKSMIIAMSAQAVLWSIAAYMGLWTDAPDGWLAITLPLPATSEDTGFWAALWNKDFAPVEVGGRVWVASVATTLAAPFMAMSITVFQSANQRFSSKRSRSASFSLWYMIMNVGAAVAGYAVVDGVRLWFHLDNSYILFIAAALVAAATLSAVFIRKETQTATEDEKAKDKKVHKLSWLQNLNMVIRQVPFWKLVVLLVAVVGVRAIFSYMYLLMPKYWLRVIGEDVAMGTLQAINPICIVIGIILTIPIIGRFNVFKMLVVGAVISSASLLIMVLPYSLFGSTMANGYFNMAIVALITLSIGEILWSPKLNEFTATIAPKGMEGTYLGMSMLPWFVAKTVVSMMSGHMLLRWCPDGISEKIANGEVSFWNSPEAMWFWLFVWAFAGVAIALIFRGWLTSGTNPDPKAEA